MHITLSWHYFILQQSVSDATFSNLDYNKLAISLGTSNLLGYAICRFLWLSSELGCPPRPLKGFLRVKIFTQMLTQMIFETQWHQFLQNSCILTIYRLKVGNSCQFRGKETMSSSLVTASVYCSFSSGTSKEFVWNRVSQCDIFESKD